MQDLRGPWSAPGAGIYDEDGEMVCTLGTAEVVAAFRKRGDTNGAVMADFAKVIAAAPTMLKALELIQEWAAPSMPGHTDRGKLKRICEFAELAIEATGRIL